MLCVIRQIKIIIYYGDLMLGIIKGDNRYKYLKEFYSCILSDDLHELYNIDYLLLPFKGIDSLGIISGTSIFLEDILKQNSIRMIFVGHISNKLIELQNKYGFKIYELLIDDTFVKENAFLTAKCIITHLSNSDLEIADYSYLILGYGNISFYLAKLLKAYNAYPSVLTFNSLEKKYASLENYKCITDIKKNYDIIINTIPSNLDLNYSMLINSRVIDVASYPYGFNHNDIDKYKINYELLAGLPSRYAPASAALLIKKILDKNILSCDLI